MNGTRDRRLLYATAFLRATATGFAGVLLGLYLARMEFSLAAIGAVVASGLAGAAVASLAVTVFGDLRGRRRALTELALLGSFGSVGLIVASHPVGMAIAAFAGMINGMGRDRGASLILEQAALPSTVDAAGRTRTLAVYSFNQDIGHALGSLLAGLPGLLASRANLDLLEAHRIGFGVYAAILLSSALLYRSLSSRVDAAKVAVPRVSRSSRSILVRLSALFAVDSIGGGFLTTALLTVFFVQRFGTPESTVAALFASARVLNAGSHLLAAWLASRIGLVNTMVFTHLPSSLLLVTVAFAPTFPVAAVLFLMREGLVEMDVPTRQSFVLAVVGPDERTFASGVTNLVRMTGWAAAPAVAGVFMGRGGLAVPLVAGAAMKIAYDLLLWRSFRLVRPPEER